MKQYNSNTHMSLQGGPQKLHNYGVLNEFPKCLSKNEFLYLFMNYRLSDVTHNSVIIAFFAIFIDH